MPVFKCALEVPVSSSGTYIFPNPIDTNEQKILEVSFADCEASDTILDTDGVGEAFLLSLSEGQNPQINITFEEPGVGLADRHFGVRDSRFERASLALIKQVGAQFPDLPLVQRIPLLIQFIADHFTYAARDVHLGHDDEAMPALECGLTPGTCVDMHTLSVAALRGLGVQAAYVMGCHIGEGKTESATGHCWMNVRLEGVAHHWDISHHIQSGIREITPALNPKPGRRFALSAGRGRVFTGQEGQVKFPSLSGFHALDGALKGQNLRTIGRFFN